MTESLYYRISDRSSWQHSVWSSQFFYTFFFYFLAERNKNFLRDGQVDLFELNFGSKRAIRVDLLLRSSHYRTSPSTVSIPFTSSLLYLVFVFLLPTHASPMQSTSPSPFKIVFYIFSRYSNVKNNFLIENITYFYDVLKIYFSLTSYVRIQKYSFEHHCLSIHRVSPRPFLCTIRELSPNRPQRISIHCPH